MSVRSALELSHAIVNSTSATTVVVAAVATQRVSIYRMLLVLGTPGVTITFQDTAGSALSAPYQIGANGSMVIDVSVNTDPWFQSGTGLGFQIFQSGTTQISADIYYLQGP